MCKLRYKLLSPIRLLLPLSTGLFVTPFFVDDLMNYYVLPVFYFFGSYFFFLNFPTIAEKLHQQPIYLEDLVLARGGELDHTFQRWYNVIMNFVLAALFAAFADYVILRGVGDLPLIEMLAIIGGNISLYMKTQDSVGKTLMSFIHILKTNEENRHDENSTTAPCEIEMVDQLGVQCVSVVEGAISKDGEVTSMRI